MVAMAELKKITESTTIPISLVITLLGLAAWVATLKSELTQAANNIDRVEKMQTEFNRTMSSIDERLSRIEGKVGARHKTKDDE